MANLKELIEKHPELEKYPELCSYVTGLEVDNNRLIKAWQAFATKIGYPEGAMRFRHFIESFIDKNNLLVLEHIPDLDDPQSRYKFTSPCTKRVIFIDEEATECCYYVCATYEKSGKNTTI